jgi:hypothetical protein
MNYLKTRFRLFDKQGNCALWGCAGLVVISILGVIIVTVSLKLIFNNLRDTYTDDTAVELPRVEMEDSDIEALIEKVDNYYDDLTNGDASTPFTISEIELNALIQNHPELEHFSEIVYLTLENDLLNGQLSIPLDGIPGLSDRYFNGNASFELVFEDNALAIFLIEAELNGDPIPDDFLADVRKENLANELYGDSDTRDVMRRIEDIEIRNGTIIITPKISIEDPEESIE